MDFLLNLERFKIWKTLNFFVGRIIKVKFTKVWFEFCESLCLENIQVFPSLDALSLVLTQNHHIENFLALILFDLRIACKLIYSNVICFKQNKLLSNLNKDLEKTVYKKLFTPKMLRLKSKNREPHAINFML